MRRVGSIGFFALVLAAAWLAVALWLPYQGFPKGGVLVDVPRGASARTTAGLLAENGVVRSRIAFELLSRWRSRRTLQAGEYLFDHPMTPSQVFQAIAEGRVFLITLTVPEGANKFDVAALVEQQGLAGRQAFLAAVEDPAPIRDLAPAARNLEGFLFPATYEFPGHVTPQEIVGAMARRFREAWQALPETDRSHSALPVDGVVTLASMVERETSVPAERPIIAGVFYNRLDRGLTLQCDPTVIYALRLAEKYGGSLGSGDLNFHSPYNTYRHAGLPPGPIANPGEASLRAALAPAHVDYLYFVASAQGGHFFSRTLREHNHNVALYRRMLAQNAQAQVGDDAPSEARPQMPAKKPPPKRPR